MKILIQIAQNEQDFMYGVYSDHIYFFNENSPIRNLTWGTTTIDCCYSCTCGQCAELHDNVLNGIRTEDGDNIVLQDTIFSQS